MDAHHLEGHSQEMLDKQLSVVAFYKQVKQADPIQYSILMQHSRLLEYRIGEVVIGAGQKDNWFHFLLRGQLVVYAGQGFMDVRRVNYITSGEAFGDLAVLLDQRRTATVIVDARCKRAVVFSTDFSIFGSLKTFDLINLGTKLIYYRNLVHSLRWKLELYRTRYPRHRFSSHHHRVKLYLGPRDTMDELESLDQQARQLAKLLIDWNLEFTRDMTESSVS